MCVCVCTQYFSQCGGSSVQYHKRPKHCSHVEDDIAQKRPGGHSKRFDQRHAARDHRGNEYTSSCGGREGDLAQHKTPGFHILKPISLFICVFESLLTE